MSFSFRNIPIWPKKVYHEITLATHTDAERFTETVVYFVLMQ